MVSLVPHMRHSLSIVGGASLQIEGSTSQTPAGENCAISRLEDCYDFP